MKNIRPYLVHAAVFSLLSLPILVSAQGSGRVGDISGTFQNPLGAQATDIKYLIDKVLSVFIQIGVVVVVVAFVYVGFKFVMARGSEKEVTEAKNALLWTVVGSAVLLGAKVISVAIRGTINQLGVQQ